MGAAELVNSRLHQALKLGDEDVDEVVIPDGLWQASTTDYHLCLVGRLLARRPVNFEGLCASLRSMNLPVKGMIIKQIPPDRFLFRFNHVLDRNRALDGCPWSFEKNVLVLSGINENENPMHVDLNWCDFHVHVHDLPLSKMNLGIATFIGNKIGKFKDLEMEPSGSAWGATLRIRIAINITLLLPRALKLKTTMGEEQLVTFTYERLPNFCYICGCLGHIAKYCLKQFEDGFQDPGVDTPFGPWLRAPIPNRSRPTAASSSHKQGPTHSASTQKGSSKRGAEIFRGFATQGGAGIQSSPRDASRYSERVAESNTEHQGCNLVSREANLSVDRDRGQKNMVTSDSGCCSPSVSATAVPETTHC
ncbi:UNVERIFIED_CONTAM: hypothetical protein Sradi_1604700 [Sesamum radiatum]|uniref:CCHC-type domain-containing protein n=1 Tax=Sesamum radiatum TaxID=300843 RepID=A0AAW2UCK2_SESRA